MTKRDRILRRLRIEELEPRIAPTGEPSIGSLWVNPYGGGLITRPYSVDLNARDVSDPNSPVNTWLLVEFYRDANDNGTLEPATDQLLGADSTVPNGYSYGGSISVSSASFPLGRNTFLARAQDAEGLWSMPVSAVGIVQEPFIAAPGHPFTFVDGDGDTITVSVGGQAGAKIMDANGGTPDHADIASISLARTDYFISSGSGISTLYGASLLTISDDNIGPGTVKLGHIDTGTSYSGGGPGPGPYGILQFRGGTNTTVLDTTIQIGGTLSALNFLTKVENVGIAVQGDTGKILFNKDVVNANVTITPPVDGRTPGSVKTLTVNGGWTGGSIDVAGSITTLTVRKALDGATLTAGGQVKSASLKDVRNCNASFGSGPFYGTIKISGALSDSSLDVEGQVKSVSIVGNISNSSLQVNDGSIGSAAFLGAVSGFTLAADSFASVKFNRSAQDVSVISSGNLTSLIFGSTATNVTVNAEAMTTLKVGRDATTLSVTAASLSSMTVTGALKFSTIDLTGVLGRLTVVADLRTTNVSAFQITAVSVRGNIGPVPEATSGSEYCLAASTGTPFRLSGANIPANTQTALYAYKDPLTP